MTRAHAATTGDVCTRSAAQAWLDRRARRGAAIGVALAATTPLTSMAVHPCWTGAAIAVALALGLYVAGPDLRLAHRARSILRVGDEREGHILDVRVSPRTHSRSQKRRIVITVQTDTHTVMAALEQWRWRPLPPVARGAAASVWTVGARAWVATGGAVFEGR